MTLLISQIEKFVQKDLEGLCAAHDFAHIDRVRKMAKSLCTKEGLGDREIVEAGALLHEYLDEKFFSDEEIATREQAIISHLRSFGATDIQVQNILFIIQNVGFGKSLSRKADFPYTIEMQLVEDADRLDAIGAIAIARTFTYGGKKGVKIYNDEKFEKGATSREEYRNFTKTSSIGHFYEKLLLLKDLIHTKSGKGIAEKRHEFMELFLKQFYREWNLEDM